MSYQYDYGFVRTHPIIWEKLGEDVVGGRHKAVMYQEDGSVTVATSAEEAVGIFLATLSLEGKQGDDVEVLVKDIGLLQMSESTKKGDRITVNAFGQGAVASEGDTVFAVALTACSCAGATVEVCLK